MPSLFNFSVISSVSIAIYGYLISSYVDTFQVFFLCAISIAGLFLTGRLIPKVSPFCIKANLFGRDINKKRDEKTEKIPESLGIVPAMIFLMGAISLQWVFRSYLGVYNAALISMCMMLFLGFADDVLDLSWSIKIFFSFLAAFPLLIAYDGSTIIVIPKPIRFIFGTNVELQLLYHFYMLMMVMFCTNSINIYAGINGLETGQSVIIAIFILIHNYLEITSPEKDNHILSIFLTLPFLSTVLGLTYFNWYPSRVFVGDSFTYFAGMTFAVVGVLGHFSKTLMILFIPQLINFIISLPQLFKIIPCPRHRLPKLVPETGKLHYSKNYTVINLWLYIFGDTTEKKLCIYLVLFQAVCCTCALLIRHNLEFYYY
eukprot:TRINITY_DN15855_c0_g1_i1.p1 TRINITY_DN15855_c0_g1~~TRINITY_DN15855_c0_g1_i1.p1  ORF type:complete len:372 (-),score=45.63 TRINITY_DN15855_c0_g1_i1:80-1195(-)